MVLRKAYVIGRTGRNRPSFVHRLVDGYTNRTVCGLDVSPWSRRYLTHDQMESIIEMLCRGACRPGTSK